MFSQERACRILVVVFHKALKSFHRCQFAFASNQLPSTLLWDDDYTIDTKSTMRQCMSYWKFAILFN